MFSSCGIGFISPTLCRLEMGTTCGRIDGDFSSPMKYGTIASRPGMLSNYQTFRLLLILCMNKNCCKPFLRSLNSWRAVRFSFLFCQTQIAKDRYSQSVQTQTKGWSSLLVASPLLQPCHISGQHSSEGSLFNSRSWGNSPILFLPSSHNECYFASGNFVRVPPWFSFSLNKTKFEYHQSLSALKSVSEIPQKERTGLKHPEWTHC